VQLYLLIALGGALGSVLRYWLNGIISMQWETFPMGTLVINVTGSFVIGFFSSLTRPDGRWFVPPNGRLFFMTGVCGGYTTFSSFSLQTLTLAQDGEWLKAGGNVVGSVTLCLIAAWLGHVLAATINQLR
jgi:CrcB protein